MRLTMDYETTGKNKNQADTGSGDGKRTQGEVN